jgi:hypothetical protein
MMIEATVGHRLMPAGRSSFLGLSLRRLTLVYAYEV